MAYKDITELLEALEPFYQNGRIEQEECKYYMSGIEKELIKYGIRMHSSEVKRKTIEGASCMLEISQRVLGGASEISLTRYDRKKDNGLKLVLYSQKEESGKDYLPMALEVKKGKGRRITHDYSRGYRKMESQE
ncbi:MAG: hypothetical protein ACMXYL_01530 [Candidatus Woesearchaeota archaeon]